MVIRKYDNFSSYNGNFMKKTKYENPKYDNYFEKIVIFEFQNMTQKNQCLKGHLNIT